LLQNSDLTFFPVNNRLGRDDPTFKSLMSSIENEIDVSDYVHQEYPISWLDTFDKLKATRSPFITYADVLDIARSSGVNELEVAEMLSFLHDMGMLMWHEEEKLRDIVIMDPISFFVSPATKVICDHETTYAYGVERKHHRDIHRDLSRRYRKDFDDMKNRGCVSDRLMQELLSECGENRQFVLDLMIKYGLVSRLVSRNSSISSSSSSSIKSADDTAATFLVSYLSPRLLPLYPQREDAVASNPWKNSFYFLFTSSNYLKYQKVISWSDVKESGFLPRGFFERLICM